MPVDTRTILVAVGVDAAIAVGCATLMSVLRIAKPTRSFYAPKRNLSIQDKYLPGYPQPGAPQPTPLPLSLLTWVYPLLRLPEREIIRVAGLDVAIYLRLLRFGIVLSLLLCVWCLAVVLPINATGGELEAILAATRPAEGGQKLQLGPGQTEDIAASIASGTFTFSNFDRLSMANISPGSPRLWAHLVSVYVVTAITMRLLWYFSRAATELRFQFLADQPIGGPSHAVLVTDIPGVPSGTFVDKLSWVLDNTALRLLPNFVKRPVQQAWQHSFAALDHVTKRAAADLKGRFVRTSELDASGDAVLAIQSNEDVKVLPLAEPAEQPPVKSSSSGASSSRPSRRTSEADVSFVYITRQEAAGQARPVSAFSAAAGTAAQPSPTEGAVERSTSPTGVSLTTCRQRSVTAKGAAALELASRRASAQDAVEAGGGTFAPDSVAEHIRQQTFASLTSTRMKELAQGHPDGRATYETNVSGGSSHQDRAAVRAAHDEWRRAADRLRLGLSVKELVAYEYELVYGADAVASVHPLRYSNELAGLEMQYTNAKQALEDQLNHYQLLLLRGGRRPGALMRLRAFWGQSLTGQLQRSRLPIVPITLKKVSLTSLFTPGWAKRRFQAANAAAPVTEILSGSVILNTDAARQQAHNLVHFTQQQLPELLHQQLRHLRQPTQIISSGSVAGGQAAGVAAAAQQPPAAGASEEEASSVDVLTYQLAWLQELVAKIHAAKAVATHVAQPSAFVTFRTRSDQVMAATTLQTTDEACWRMRPAPSPDDVLWSNLRLRRWEVAVRRQLLTGVLVVLVLFYAIPVGAVQAILQLERLEGTPVIGTIVKLPVVRSILLGVLPGLALRLFVLLLPILLYALNNHAGFKAASDVDFAVATQYFTVQLFTVFVSSFISGSLLNQIQGIINNPSSILQILGTGVPQVSSFFVLYIIFIAFVGRSFVLLRPLGLIIYIVQLSAAATTRARQRAAQAQYRMFGPALPTQTITILLALVFSVINPVILVAALISFCTSFVVDTYGWVYAYRRWYESGGRMWRQVFNQVMTGVYLFQVVMLALLAVKRFPYAVLLLPLILGTALLHAAAMRAFSRPWELLSLRDARQLDMQDAESTGRFSDAGGPRSAVSGSSKPAEHEMRTSYVPPSFRTNFLAELQELAQEVRDVQDGVWRHNAVHAHNRRTSVASLGGVSG